MIITAINICSSLEVILVHHWSTRGVFSQPYLAEETDTNALLKVTEVARVRKLRHNPGLLILKFNVFSLQQSCPFYMICDPP